MYMRIAIISDLHANKEAIDAVLDDIAEQDISEIWCTGDVVDYGPNPGYAVEKVKQFCKVVIKGNHDEVVTNLNSPLIHGFHPIPKKTVEWTKGQLKPDQLEYLARLPYLHRQNGIAAVHGTLYSRWDPLRDPDFGAGVQGNLEYNCLTSYASNERRGDPLETKEVNSNLGRCFQSMQEMGVKVLFIGHVQRAEASYLKGSKIYSTNVNLPGPFNKSDEKTVPISKEHIYVLNSGSVGQPRDGDPRASYIIYDATNPDAPVARFRRVYYDFTTTRRRILQEGLPPSLGARLEKGW